MFKLNEIRELIRLLDETTIAEINVESAGTKLTIKKSEVVGVQTISTPVIQQPAVATAAPVSAVPAPAPVQSEAPEVKKEVTPEKEPAKKGDVEDPSLVKIVSPMVGTFYRAPAPDAPPYVQVGDKVTERTVVCIVEAMKLMNEIEAEVSGEIVDILVENGQLVEYGQPMFLVKPE